MDWMDEAAGRCGHCGKAWELVGPGKAQPACNCGSAEWLWREIHIRDAFLAGKGLLDEFTSVRAEVLKTEQK